MGEFQHVLSVVPTGFFETTRVVSGAYVKPSRAIFMPVHGDTGVVGASFIPAGRAIVVGALVIPSFTVGLRVSA